MKRFFQTIMGKTILFLLCLVFSCALLASAGGALLFSVDDGYLYTHSEQETTDRLLYDQLYSKAYDYVWAAIDGENIYWNGLKAEVRDENSRRLYVSEGEEKTSQWKYTYEFGVLKDSEGNVRTYYDSEEEIERVYYTVHLNVDETAGSAYSMVAEAVHIAWQIRYAIYGILAAALFLTILSFVGLMSVSGRNAQTGELVPGPFFMIPYDLILAATGIAMLMLILICGEILRDDITIIIGCLMMGVLAMVLFLALCMTTASRIKQHTLVKNTIIFRCLKLCMRVLRWCTESIKKLHRFNLEAIRKLPILWKAVAAFLVVALVEFILLINTINDPEEQVVFFLLIKMIFFFLVVYIVLGLRDLQAGGRALAAGDLSYVTDTKRMRGVLKEHGENLNSIAFGMSAAVEERLKSERMKTELITNVSHDIKTPLTSIINYGTLIGNETCENEKITEYAEVMVRQSERLKRLIEDLIEASKASTGNLEVNLAPCNAAVFLSQAAGEYEEKLAKAELTLVTKQPDHELRILADGRRMWRIFDNLLNNICKYAMSGTRVYLTLEQVGEEAVITFKNTSREALDLSEEELLERFTRGDGSRHTEGNGLGLSIAKSMAELQGGSLSLSVDGDLFKAVLRFPLV